MDCPVTTLIQAIDTQQLLKPILPANARKSRPNRKKSSHGRKPASGVLMII
jgi:hypothetical protein